jgi:hypothetical protein
MMKAWEEFLELTEEEPGAWLLYRDFMTGAVAIEFFDPDHYSGQLEQGTGDWHVSGTLEAVVAQARGRYLKILKDRAEKKDTEKT